MRKPIRVPDLNQVTIGLSDVFVACPGLKSEHPQSVRNVSHCTVNLFESGNHHHAGRDAQRLLLDIFS